MFVPSAESLLNAMNLDKASLEGSGTVQVPAPLLKLLLQIALAAADFDEDGYLKSNPDVAKAIAIGGVESARIHYIGYGYFEGRRGGGPEVDENWYLQKYLDVDAAVRERKISSANDHFHAIGAGEGRSPNAEQQEEAMQWKRVLKVSNEI